MSMLQTPAPQTPSPKKTTGPNTKAGRLAASRNSFKHGFSGSGKVLPDDLRDEVHAKRDAYADHFQPEGPIETELVFQMALASVRTFRIANADEAQTAERVRHAVQRWDVARADEVRGLADRLDAEPAEAVRLLERTAEGNDFLADEWHALKDALLESGSWTIVQAVRALRLLGMNNEPGDHSTQGLADYWRDVETAQSGNVSARNALADIADQEIENHSTLGDQLWNQFDLPDRNDAPRRALFDASPEGLKRSRYLADAERLFYRSLNELNRLQSQRGKSERRPTSPSRPVSPKPTPIADAPRNESPSTPVQPGPARSSPAVSNAPRNEFPPVPASSSAAPKSRAANAPKPSPQASRNELFLDPLNDSSRVSRINLLMVPPGSPGFATQR